MSSIRDKCVFVCVCVLDVVLQLRLVLLNVAPALLATVDAQHREAEAQHSGNALVSGETQEFSMSF